ncbi:uncharacterized protein LOC108864515 [Galendromus occidentalis]|uniref:Uncharacterized protein LOC108864515 n=1 Tax=Galendromus occidentalis TaxID=34638 RepID=A0AAJ7L4Y5_9ACAR|nr:uncharacterized protein LOC108864515 [Galendromus occidentalis]
MAGRPKLVSVNSAITCSLCKGYLINAMTLCRCMHTFCRSCIHRYLDTSSTCPTCQQRVFRSRMDTHMLPDHTLQSIVYRVVPGLYEDEMRRRRQFYENTDERSDERTEERGFPERVILSDKDKVSVVLAYRENEEYPKLYLELAAAMPVSVLLNFLRDKCKPLPTLVVHLILEQGGVGTRDAPDRLLLDPDFTIFDVCYIAKYNLQGPLKLSFTFVQFDPESFKDRRLLESSTMSESSILKKSLNHRYRDEKINGDSRVANKAVKNVQYTKVKADTKSIVLSKNSILESAVNSMKTYSRNAGSNGGNGNLCQLADGVVTGANASEGDSTEEEVDSWDSNVSTTIDSLTNSQHSSQQTPNNSAGSSSNSIVGKLNKTAALVAAAINSSGSPSASKTSKHSKNSSGVSSIHANNNPSLIVARPQSLRIDAMREKSDKPAGKQAISPVVQQSAPVGHHKRVSQDKKSHHHHHHHHHKNHNFSSPSTASASTVAGKPPTVLKIKLNTSPTTSETLTITSPPIRETRLKALEYPAVTSIKIKPIVASPSTPSPPSSSRETRASSVESGGRKKRRSEDRDRTIKEKSPSFEDEPVAPKKSKKAKTKKTTNQNTQAVINDTAYVSDQPKDLLSTSNFGWGDSSLWESQLRIPSPLTVPLTVSVARRKANQAKNRTASLPAPPATPSSFLEENFSLKKNQVVVKPANNRIWRKRRHVSPPPVPVKLPPPDFKMSSTLSAVLEAVKNDKVYEVLSSPQHTVSCSPSSSPLRDCYFSKPADHNDFPSRRQSETDHFLDSGVRPGSSSSGDINADVFRMEFPVAAINPLTPAVSPKMDRSQSYASPTAESLRSEFCLESTRRKSFSSTTSPSSCSPSSSSMSCTEVKFSIHNILSNESSPPQIKVKQQEDNESKELNIHESIEMFITNISKFFWALEASKGRVSNRMWKTFLAKKVALERILTLLRKLTIVVAPNQIERVLQLESAIQKYFNTDPFISLASSAISPPKTRTPLESLKPDTLKMLEQNDVRVTPIYVKTTAAKSSSDTFHPDHGNECEPSLSIVRLTPPSHVASESSIDLSGIPATLIATEFSLQPEEKSVIPSKIDDDGSIPPPLDPCGEPNHEVRLSMPSDPEAETFNGENSSEFNSTACPETKAPVMNGVLSIDESDAASEEQEITSSEPCEDVRSALVAVLEAVERSSEVDPQNPEVPVAPGNRRSEKETSEVEGPSCVQSEDRAQVPGQLENGAESSTPIGESMDAVDTEERQVVTTDCGVLQIGQNESIDSQIDHNGSDDSQVEEVSVEDSEPELAPTRASCAVDESHAEAVKAQSEDVISPAELPMDSVDESESTESSMRIDSTEKSSIYASNMTIGDFTSLETGTQPQIQVNGIDSELDDTIGADDLDQNETSVPSIELLKGDSEAPLLDIDEDGSDDLMDVIGTSLEPIGLPSEVIEFDAADGMVVDCALDAAETSELRVDSIEPEEPDVDGVVGSHVNHQADFENVPTESDPKKQSKTFAVSRGAAYNGSFGAQNQCKTLVPYVPLRRDDSFKWASDTLRSDLGESAIHDLFRLRIPRISFFGNEVSTCDLAPKTHKTGLELVPYVARSENPLENLFRLTGLIPERVPIPSPVHDYIMKGSSTGIPNSEKQTKTHSLLDFLKLQQKSHVVQQNTSPNFGDIDMDVHRWEEVDELGGVAPPSGVANVPGSLNVH